MISYEAMIRRDVLIAYLAVPISDATLVLRRTHSHTHAHTHAQPYPHTHTQTRTRRFNELNDVIGSHDNSNDTNTNRQDGKIRQRKIKLTDDTRAR